MSFPDMAPDVMREMGELIMAEWRGMAPIDKLAWCASEVPPSTEFHTEALIIYKVSPRTLTAQNHFYWQF